MGKEPTEKKGKKKRSCESPRPAIFLSAWLVFVVSCVKTNGVQIASIFSLKCFCCQNLSPKVVLNRYKRPQKQPDCVCIDAVNDEYQPSPIEIQRKGINLSFSDPHTIYTRGKFRQVYKPLSAQRGPSASLHGERGGYFSVLQRECIVISISGLSFSSSYYRQQILGLPTRMSILFLSHEPWCLVTLAATSHLQLIGRASGLVTGTS